MKLMSQAAMATLALMACGAASSASAASWAAAYTGTIVATYADGHAVKVFIEPDHTFAIQPPSGDALHGTWQDAGDQTCFTITQPAAAAGGPPTCVSAKDYKVGDGFDGKDSTGAFHGVIQAGR